MGTTPCRCSCRWVGIGGGVGGGGRGPACLVACVRWLDLYEWGEYSGHRGGCLHTESLSPTFHFPTNTTTTDDDDGTHTHTHTHTLTHTHAQLVICLLILALLGCWVRETLNPRDKPREPFSLWRTHNTFAVLYQFLLTYRSV
jgi:hypothetical protein